METKDKPKLLILAQLPPPVHGVSVMSQAVVASGILRNNFEICVLPIQFATALQDVGRNNSRKLLKLWVVTIKLVYQCLVFRPDLVYFTLVPTGIPFYRDTMLLTLIRWLGIKPILHLHGIGIRQESHKGINRFLYRWVFHDVDVIHLSPLLYYDIENHVPKERCHFLANGIRSEVQHPRKKAHQALTKGPVRLLFLSNIMEEKGPLDFIAALGILKARGIHFHGTMAGAIYSETCYHQLSALAKSLNLGDAFHFVGPQFGDEKEALFGNADIFVFPTHRDSFPLVLLEAMAHSLPIVASSEGAIPEIIADGVTGILFPKKNIEKMAQILESLIIDSDARTKMGKLGEERFANHFTLEIFETNLTRILVSCCQS
ncbi:MAG: glycosyltransferase family 4 protein [Nitrospirae bacterium]|nr:glycosyltransferase family 4 protein [Magnetococcales bacterium]